MDTRCTVVLPPQFPHRFYRLGNDYYTRTFWFAYTRTLQFSYGYQPWFGYTDRCTALTCLRFNACLGWTTWTLAGNACLCSASTGCNTWTYAGRTLNTGLTYHRLPPFCPYRPLFHGLAYHRWFHGSNAAAGYGILPYRLTGATDHFPLVHHADLPS